MLSKVSLSVVVILLASSGVPAGIMQYQDFTVGLEEAIELLHGHQTGCSFKSVMVNNDQSANEPCPTLAHQVQTAFLTQTAEASGGCAVIGVLTTLNAMGLQDQMIGDCCEPKMQVQGLALDGLQAITKSDGPGSGSAMNQAILNQNHGGSNAAGHVSETSTIMALQQANLDGDACATGAVVSGMTVTTSQAQSTY